VQGALFGENANLHSLWGTLLTDRINPDPESYAKGLDVLGQIRISERSRREQSRIGRSKVMQWLRRWVTVHCLLERLATLEQIT
jgi:hypothetical protein